MNPPLVFAYGTLRRGVGTVMHDVLARHGEPVARGWMRGKLYEVDGYPGAIESGSDNDRVFGEIYRIGSAEILAVLDDYEECSEKYPEPHEYVRKPLSIFLAGGGSVTAWVYVFNRDVANLVLIPGGDYLIATTC